MGFEGERTREHKHKCRQCPHQLVHQQACCLQVFASERQFGAEAVQFLTLPLNFVLGRTQGLFQVAFVVLQLLLQMGCGEKKNSQAS